MNQNSNIIGAKIALLKDDYILTYLRDDNPEINWPAYWDLPGGGHEGDETPAECVIRETREEFGITLDADTFIWFKIYPGNQDSDRSAYFYAAPITQKTIDEISFGHEGQYWKMMPIDEFLSHEKAVPYLQERLLDFLKATA